MKKVELDVRPQASVYQYFTRLNYTEWYALAEFVDNSTASYYAHEKELKHKLTVEINYDAVTNTITIEDDAYGMELADFKRAILLESVPNIQGGRNEFGMGLKTAATWFGRKWTVESTELKSPNLYVACMDLDQIVEKKTNTIDIHISKIDKKTHYTKITIEKLNRTLNTKKIKNKIIDILQSMYRRDLDSGRIEILYNGTLLEFEEYEPLVFRNQTWKKEINFNFLYCEKKYNVSGFVGILKKGGFDKAGFALFRRNRVIIGGLGENYKPKEIFGQDQSQISLKLYGEINMDAFESNQAKDGFSWSSELQEMFINQLKIAILDYLSVAKMSVKERVKEEEDNKTVISNELINKDDVENEDKKVKKPNNTISEQKNIEVSENVITQNTNETNNIEKDINYKFEHSGIQYVLKYEKIEDKPSLYKYDALNNIITINQNHTYINSISQKDYINVGKLILAFVLAEVKAKNSSTIEGYMTISMMHNQFNKILGEIKVV